MMTNSLKNAPLRIRQLSKSFAQPEGAVTVLDRVDFSLNSGQSAALRGDSGSGKSTLLHLIAG